jgi:putative Mn2+ efflux pump MntP
MRVRMGKARQVASTFFIAGVVLQRAALATGFLAAAIAVGGFVVGTQALLNSDEPQNLQRSTAAGGVLGLLFGISIIFIDVITS